MENFHLQAAVLAYRESNPAPLLLRFVEQRSANLAFRALVPHMHADHVSTVAMGHRLLGHHLLGRHFVSQSGY